jgi:hypothetical protein
MSPPNRNDSCPCGSGKKYKNCCLPKDRAARVRDSTWRHDELAIWDRIFAFARRPEFGPQLVVASNLFWNGNYGVEGINSLDRFEVSRFLDWCIMDYRLEGSRKRLIELFWEQLGPALSPTDRIRIQAWQASHLGIYRLLQQQSDRMQVIDVLAGSEWTLSEGATTQRGVPGDLWLGRILPASDPVHFSWGAALLPAKTEAGLVSFVKTAYESQPDHEAAASWHDFLSGNGYLFNHYLLRVAGDAVGRRRAGGIYYDASGTIEKHHQIEQRLRQETAKRADEQRRDQKEKSDEGPALRQTRGGILLPGQVQYKGSKILKP